MMERFVLFIFIVIPPTVYGQSQFVCTYVSEIKVTHLDTKSPRTEVKKVSDRYTFLLEKDGTASYINLALGTKNRATALFDGSKVTFTEWNRTDNFFVATVFLSHQVPEGNASIMSFHGWGSHSTYFPSLSIGSCVAFNR